MEEREPDTEHLCATRSLLLESCLSFTAMYEKTPKYDLTVKGLNGLNDLWPYGPMYRVCCCHTLKKGVGFYFFKHYLNGPVRVGSCTLPPWMTRVELHK